MFSPTLVDKGVTFAAASAGGSCFCCSRCSFDVISDSERYIEISFSVSPVHVEKDPSLISCLIALEIVQLVQNDFFNWIK